MNPLTDPRLICLTGSLFVILGPLASALLIVQLSDIRYALLLAIAIWAFCRAYTLYDYFAKWSNGGGLIVIVNIEPNPAK
jgi:hypothetical protein